MMTPEERAMEVFKRGCTCEGKSGHSSDCGGPTPGEIADAIRAEGIEALEWAAKFCDTLENGWHPHEIAWQIRVEIERRKAPNKPKEKRT